ncbi:nischarin [Macrosteles quadrilineatus]|uniref:nischarin n=1 Tax=Macrosteles quadrilineatus TaxID=74068 RepID=UPI0023E2BFBA|nr:nischarin [Macrosteles quadrilineatus]
MACFLFNKDRVYIHIPDVCDVDKVTFYNIVVKVGDFSWKVKHRYNDFVTLHDKLVVDHCVSKDILPSKKLIGKRDPVFIQKRRLGLETYLSNVVNFLKETMPRELAMFLDFHKYDILFLLQEMSSTFLRDGDAILSKEKSFKFNPLQLHAISERLKQPCPPIEIFDKSYDFSHVLDFCCQLLKVEVEGSWDPIESSDIIPNKCAFELSAFKNVQELLLNKVCVGRIYDTGTMRHTLRKLTVTECSLQSPADILLCDVVHKECVTEVPEEKKWLQLAEVDLSQNHIKSFGNTLLLMPVLTKLKANENPITQVDDLTNLQELSHLYLSANRINEADDFHLRLKNIVFLDLSQNLISSLRGFSSLYSLEGLDLGSNIIVDVSEVQHVRTLDKLNYLVLTGNPVATVVDYRIKVLEQFGRRAASLCLDNERPSQKELDTVAVVLALRVVKEGKAPVFSRTVEPTFPNTLQ